jgi:hypothetical protein
LRKVEKGYSSSQELARSRKNLQDKERTCKIKKELARDTPETRLLFSKTV